MERLQFGWENYRSVRRDHCHDRSNGPFFVARGGFFVEGRIRFGALGEIRTLMDCPAGS